ncbi:MAG: hypothetical protein IIB85_01465, partial [Chloroflexi bacterium]|nr:hypothetical protein [Chloroflexota bacterium]
MATEILDIVDLTTVDPAWGLDMTGTNVIPATGAVHMCARKGDGLFIYNGLDVDFIGTAVSGTGSGQLAKIWLQELESSISDDTDLRCAVA